MKIKSVYPTLQMEKTEAQRHCHLLNGHPAVSGSLQLQAFEDL